MIDNVEREKEQELDAQTEDRLGEQAGVLVYRMCVLIWRCPPFLYSNVHAQPGCTLRVVACF